MEQGRDLWLCLPDRKQLWLAAAVSICTTSESRSKTGLAFYMGLMVLLSCSNPPHTISRKPQQMDWGLARGVVGREHWLNGWCSIFSIHVCPTKWQGMNCPLGFSTYSKGVECWRMWIGGRLHCQMISVSHFICVKTGMRLPSMKILKGSANIEFLQI